MLTRTGGYPQQYAPSPTQNYLEYLLRTHSLAQKPQYFLSLASPGGTLGPGAARSRTGLSAAPSRTNKDQEG